VFRFQSEIDRNRQRLLSTSGGFQNVLESRWHLTRPGQWITVISFVFWAAGFIGDRYAFLVVTAVMAPLLLLSIPLSRAVLSGLALRVGFPDRVVAGRPFRLVVDARKTGGWLGTFSVRLAPGFLRGKHMMLVYLPRGGEQRIEGLFQIPRRGIYLVEWIRVSTLFPFGLVRRNAIVPVNRRVIVHPRAAVLRDRLVSPDLSTTLGSGIEVPKAGEDEFFGLRDHRPGDRLRNISWRSTAHLGKLVVREMRQQAEGELEVVLHTTEKHSRMLAVYVERAVAFTAGLLNQARQENAYLNLEVRGRRPGVVFVDSHPYTILRAMDLLAGFGPGIGSGPERRVPGRRWFRPRRIHVILGDRPADVVSGDEIVIDVAARSFSRRVLRKGPS